MISRKGELHSPYPVGARYIVPESYPVGRGSEVRQLPDEETRQSPIKLSLFAVERLTRQPAQVRSPKAPDDIVYIFYHCYYFPSLYIKASNERVTSCSFAIQSM
jgi:hypothetical protein